MGVRDPLSVRFDRPVRAVLLRAVRASARGQGVVTWVPSPRSERARLDAGGRTRTERAFTRAAYYQVMKIPPRRYSLKLTWGPVGPLGRRCVVRLYPRSSGYRHVASHPGTAWWNDEARRARPGRVGG